MEFSSVGTFGIRLELLKLLEDLIERDDFRTVIWNEHQYYLQHLPALQKFFNDVRLPLENQLKVKFWFGFFEFLKFLMNF